MVIEMANRKAKGIRAKTRHKLQSGGKVTVNRLLLKPEINSTVQINIEASVQRGMPHPRYQGRTGIVVGYRGSAAEVEIGKGKNAKRLIVHPVHLKVLEGGKK